ncbi:MULTISPECIES: GntR family transcriptional regulator [unclassified Agromyces]|uniref:GntR family transcriptional regulator n=1 Tax=unclassified Agromyces TaxID=2639701 RepID=UPI0007B28E71|nr:MULTISPECIES: GntR family transcriptional regulator [unclassified Agromyces]KZE94896.1 Pyruvate dehydrogenase complex repressor [Agromyces sp. NDB4Y10]MCK8607945.1 GntR family transcriptional regulator [Agromyces sp. C10]
MPLPARSPAERPKSLRDYAYAQLRDAIVSGDLAPGERLRDPELEEWLGVSRTPIREAIARLELAGLVHTRRAKQTVVAPLDTRTALAAQRIAASLHELAVRDAVPQLTWTDLEAMSNANARFAAALGADDVDAAIAADDAFHAVAVEASANPLLPGLLEQVTPLLRRLERARFGSLAGRGSVADHDRIIALCAEGRADDAARATHENWSTLGRLLHLDDEADSATTPPAEGAPWPSPTSPATG